MCQLQEVEPDCICGLQEVSAPTKARMGTGIAVAAAAAAATEAFSYGLWKQRSSKAQGHRASWNMRPVDEDSSQDSTVHTCAVPFCSGGGGRSATVRVRFCVQFENGNVSIPDEFSLVSVTDKESFVRVQTEYCFDCFQVWVNWSRVQFGLVPSTVSLSS